MVDTAPTHTPDAPPSTPRKGGINAFLHGVKALVEANPLLSILSGVLLFLVGWFGNLALDNVYRAVFPDQNLIRAQVLREQINSKTDTIGAKLEVMEANLSKVGSDGEEARVFLAAAETVMRELESLRPEISQLANEADRYTARLASAKASELASTGQSAQADFVLPLTGGMTLCPSRFTFGVVRSSSPGHVYMTVSQDGQSNAANVIPGQAVRLNGQGDSVSISYLGPQDDTGLHRFNFSCIDG